MEERIRPVVRVEGSAVRTLTLDRPASRNALDGPLLEAVLCALRDASANREVRALVLTGAGPAFSAGGDFGLIRRMRDDSEVRRLVLDGSRSLFRFMLDLDIPVVAAVNGPAVGAGCTLALLCDVVVMAESAYLADPHVGVGLVPGDGGAVLWPLLAGLPAARAYLLTGDRMSASEAHRIGLVHRTVSAERVMGEALALANRLAGLPEYAVRATKRALNLHVAAAAASTFEYALALEDRSFDFVEHRMVTDAPGGPARAGRDTNDV